MIRSEERDGVAVMVLDHGKANALNGEFLDEFNRQLSAHSADVPRGLILTAEGSIFCAGLDLVALVDNDRPEMERLLESLYQVCVSLFMFPRPVVCAMNGHAIAGGALLSLACDIRLMAQGEAKWGLNESALGISMPAYTVPMLQYALSRPVVEKLLYSGNIYPAFKARDMDILDGLEESDHLLDAAVERVVEWTASPAAFADIKHRLRAPTLSVMEAARRDNDAWLNLWFAQDTKQKIRDIVAKLRK